MRCSVCGEQFRESQMKNGYDDYPYGESYEHVCTHGLCPVCGSGEFEQEAVCVQCGSEVSQADVRDGFCRYCAEELEQTLEWVCSMLSPAQRSWMEEHPEWTRRGEGVC